MGMVRFIAIQQRVRHELLRRPGRVLGFVTFLLMFGVALIDSTWSLYIDSLTQNHSLTGLVWAGCLLLTILYYFLFSSFVEAHDERKLFFWSLLITAVSFFLYPLMQSIWPFLAIAAVNYAAFAVRNMTLGVLVRDVASTKTIGRAEGVKWLLLNVGYLFAPLVIIVLFSGTEFLTVFWIAGACLFASAVVVAFALRVREVRHRVVNPLVGFRAFFRSPQRVLVYTMRAGLTFYWSFSFVFLPLYVKETLGADKIGLVLFLIVLPLVVLEYFVGKAVSAVPYRALFVSGFLIAGLAPSPAFFVAFIVASAVGAALLEPTTEAYFFTITKRAEEEEFLGPYLTGDMVGAMAGRLFGALLLLFVGYAALALIFGLVLLSLTAVARRAAH